MTTNADNLFEEVIGKAVCHEDCNVEQLNDAHFRNKNHLFYLHGHFNSAGPFDKLVFTAPEYVNRYNNHTFIEFLQYVFQGDNAILFIGYGLNEFELIDYVILFPQKNESRFLCSRRIKIAYFNLQTVSQTLQRIGNYNLIFPSIPAQFL